MAIEGLSVALAPRVGRNRGDTKDASSTLDDFGYSPRKSTKPTIAVRAVAAEKTANTRVLHHVMGPKQRAKLTGPAPVPAPAASTAVTTKP
jgi:hypothetical protein